LPKRKKALPLKKLIAKKKERIKQMQELRAKK